MDFGPDVSTYEGKRVGLFGDYFYPLHRGHLAQIDEAATRVDVLFVAVFANDPHEQSLIAGAEFAQLSPRLRERWLSELFAARPNIRVLTAPVGSDHTASFHELALRCHHIDEVFVQDDETAAEMETALPGTARVTLPPNTPDAATIRREGTSAHWEALPRPVQLHYTKRVAFCGWESSGKSFTAEHIARVLATTCVPEYGREYYEQLGGYEDIAESQDALNTASGQLHSLERAVGNRILCVDTDLIYTQFYHLKDFGWMHPALDALVRANAEKIDEWIFLEPRNPLADDGSRFRYNDDERQSTSNSLQEMYRHYGVNLHVVDEADDAKRLQVCEELVRSFM